MQLVGAGRHGEADPMTLCLGTDLVFVPRLARSLEQAGFLDRVFTRDEQVYCGSNEKSLAGRWAAKEAAMKAMGVGLGMVALREIEVVLNGQGAPALRLHGAAERLAVGLGWSEVALSISHDGDYALAMVVAIANNH